MTSNLMKKGVVVGVLLLFIGMTFSVMSIRIYEPEKNKGGNTWITNEKNVLIDEGYPPCYVMEYVDLPPAEELSPTPKVLGDLPAQFSWMNISGQDWTTPARNQDYCGSCWAFGAMSCLESRINIAWGAPELDVDLSEQYILSCLPAAGSCAGGSSYAAFKDIKSESAAGNYCNGIIPEDCLPYSADDTIPCSDKCPDWQSKLIPISSYGCWSPHYPADVNALKSQIVNEGPVVTYFMATDDFAHWGNTHHNASDYYPYVQQSSLNHAVAIVGYKDDPSIGNGGYWIVKNSWGTRWGYNGFFNIEYGSLNIDNVLISWAKYNATLTPWFTATPVNPHVGQDIQFTDASTVLMGNLVSWTWNFGDNTSSSERNPVHAYDAVGAYQVNLTVFDGAGHSRSLARPVYVGDEAPPTTNLTLTGKRGENGWFIGSVTIRLKGTDSFSGVDYTMYNLDSQGYLRYDHSVSMYGKGHEGEHTISYYSVDRVGNAEAEKTVHFKIDVTNPTVSVVKPKAGYVYLMGIGVLRGLQQTFVVGALRANVTVSDNGSGVNKTEFYMNNTLVGVDTEAPYTYLVSGNSRGALMELKVIAYDHAGRKTSVTIPFMFYGFGVLKD